MEVDTVDAPLTRVSQPSNGQLAVRKPRTELKSKSEIVKARRQRDAQKAYGRGRGIDVKTIRDKKLRRNLSTLEDKYKEAAYKAKEAEILLENTAGFIEPETELERTYKVRQDDIQKNVAIEVAQKGFELKLNELGPYICEYSRNGRDLILAGRKGHVATMDWRDGKLGCELQLMETVRDARFLHNNQFFAVAQKKYVYIYDSQGVELHCLKKHVEVSHMEFLPYHFLLATLVSAKQLSRGLIAFVADTFPGHQRFPQIPRHLDRSNRLRNLDQTRHPRLPHPQPLQRHPPRRPAKRHRHIMVAKLERTPRETSCPPWARAIRRRRPRRSLHGIGRPGQQDVHLGRSQLQGVRLVVFHPVTSHLGRHLRHGLDRGQLEHPHHHLARPL